MVAILKSSILLGFREIRASVVFIVPALLFAYFVMRMPTAEITVGIGVPLLWFTVIGMILAKTRFTIQFLPKPGQEVPAPKPAVELSKGKTFVYGLLILTLFVSPLWGIGFLLSAPIYPMLGVSSSLAIQGLGWMLLVFLIALTLFVLVMIFEVSKVTSLVWNVAYRSVATQLPTWLLVRLGFH